MGWNGAGRGLPSPAGLLSARRAAMLEGSSRIWGQKQQAATRLLPPDRTGCAVDRLAHCSESGEKSRRKLEGEGATLAWLAGTLHVDLPVELLHNALHDG